MLDGSPNSFSTGISMNPVEDTQSSDVGDSLNDPTSGGSASGNPSGLGSLILNADPGDPASISSMAPTSSLGGSSQPGPPVQPTAPLGGAGGKPSFFKGLITQLGIALSQGAAAGVAAPRSAQGPSIAAANAAAAPQKAQEQLDSNQMAQMNIAMTQVKLHQLTMAAHQMDQDQANKTYNMARDAFESMVKSKAVEPQLIGTLDEMQKQFSQKQADYKASGGTGVLNLLVAPAPGGNNDDGKGKFALYEVQSGKTDLPTPLPSIDVLDYLKITHEQAQAAGLPDKITPDPVPAGVDSKSVSTLSVKNSHDTVMRVMNAWAQSQKNNASIAGRAANTSANITSRESEGAKNRGMRWSIAELQDRTKNSIAKAKTLSDGDDKLILRAQGEMITADKNLANAYKGFGNKAFKDLSGGDSREVRKLERASQIAHDTLDGLTAKKASITQPPKGTVATIKNTQDWALAHGFGKADTAKVVKGMKAEGWEFPKQ